MPSYVGASRELIAVFQTLADDIARLHVELQREHHPATRRHYVRGALAAVEGIAFAFRQVALGSHFDIRPVFSTAELSLLAEEAYDLNDKGEIVIRPSSPTTSRGIRFAFKALAKAENVTFELPVDRAEWRELRNAIAVRNRITHPKQSSDLLVSDEELAAIHGALVWFIDQAKQLIRLLMEAVEVRRDDLQRKLSELQTQATVPMAPRQEPS